MFSKFILLWKVIQSEIISINLISGDHFMRISDEIIHKVPFLRLFVPFVTGIGMGLVIPFSRMVYVYHTGCIILIVSLFLILLNPFRDYARRYWSGIWVFLFFLCLGLGVVALQNGKIHDAERLTTAHPLLVQIVDQPVKKNQTFKTMVQTRAYKQESQWFSRRYLLLGYFEIDSVAEKLQAGSLIWIHVPPEEIMEAGNPYEFQYGRYLADHGVHGRFFANSGEWNVADNDRPFSLISTAARIRSWAIRTLDRYQLENDALAIASALIVGERDGIEENLKDAFADAGIVHIMAVSGLHVGVIYLFFSYLLHFLVRIRHGRFIRSVIILICLWFYALVTGLNPPVMRAATMFSFIVLGQGLHRTGNVYNSLISAAFLILFINPFLIRSAGFLLSFFAVTGIVFLYPKIYNIGASRFWVWNKIWMLLSLSLAAQIGTLPLVLYFFHQFPTYVLLSNLIAIPLVSIIIYTGFFMLIFSFFPFLASALGIILKLLIEALIQVSHMVGTFPYAVIRPVHISVIEVILLFLFMTLMVLYLMWKRPSFLNASLLTGIILAIVGFGLNQHHHMQRYLMVLNVRGSTVLQYINGRTAYVFTPDTSSAIRHQIEYAISGSWQQLRVKDSQWHTLLKETHVENADAGLMFRNGFFQADKMVGYITGYQDRHYLSSKLPLVPEICIMTDHPIGPSISLMQHWHPGCVIIDSSVPWYRKSYIKKSLEEASLKYHDVSEDGAYILNLNVTPL